MREGVRTILAEAWQKYRRNLAAILTLALPVWIPCVFYEVWKKHVPLPDGLGRTLRSEVPVTVLVSILASAAVYSYLSREAAGQEAELKSAAKAGFEYWSRMFVTRFILTVAIAVGLLLFIVPGLFLLVRLSVAEALVVAEEIAGVDAIVRSWKLTAGKFMLVAGSLLVGLILPLLLSAVLLVPYCFLVDLHAWPMLAIGGCLVAIPQTFNLAVTWTLCSRLREMDALDFGP